MKPPFALNLSLAGIGLYHRGAAGWLSLGEIALDDPALGAKLAGLRRRAEALAPEGVLSKVIIPNSQILYTEIDTTGAPNQRRRRKAVARALEGLTPYAVDDMVIDISGAGPLVKVAAVARETLAEAEGFAAQHGFGPVAFVAMPEPGNFEGEPYFGLAASAPARLGERGTPAREGEPVEVIGTLPEPAPLPPPQLNGTSNPTATRTAPEMPGNDLTEAGTGDAPMLAEPDELAAPEPVTDTAPAAPDPASDAAPLAPEPATDETSVAPQTVTSRAMPEPSEPVASAPDPIADLPADLAADPSAPLDPESPHTGARLDSDEPDPPTAFADDPADDPPLAFADDLPDDPPTAFADDLPDDPPTAFADDLPAAAGDAWFDPVDAPVPVVTRHADPAPTAPRLGAAPIGTPGPTAALPAPAATRTLAANSAPYREAPLPASLEAAARTVFGAPGPDPNARKPRYLGISLSVGLILSMGAIGLWSMFLDGTITGDTATADDPGAVAIADLSEVAATAPPRRPERLLAAAPEPVVTVAAEPAPEPPPAEVALAETGRAPAEGPAADSAVTATDPGADTLASASTAGMRPGMLEDSTAAEPTTTRPVGAAELLPREGDIAATDTDRLPSAATDRDPTGTARYAAILPALERLQSDTAPAPMASPLAFGVEPVPQDGLLVAATPEGQLMPEGFTLVAGVPPVLPPARPEAVERLFAAAARLPETAAPTDAAPTDAAEATAVGAPVTGAPAVGAPILFRRPPVRPVTPGSDAASEDGAAIPAPAPDVAAAGLAASAQPEAPAVAEVAAPVPALSPPMPGAETVVAAAAAEAPVIGPPLPGRRAPLRPEVVLAAAQSRLAETAAAAADDAVASTASAEPVTDGAVVTPRATSRRAPVRPAALARGIDAALADAIATPEPDGAAVTAAASADELDEPEPVEASPASPTRAEVAKQATVRNAIRLNEVNLLAVVGSASNRRALVRLPNGDFVKLRVGDRFDGGKVAAITDRELTYVKKGRTIVLELPREG